MNSVIPAINGSVKILGGKVFAPKNILTDKTYADIDCLFLSRLKNSGICNILRGELKIEYVQSDVQSGAYVLEIYEDKAAIQCSDRSGYGNALTTLFQLFVLGNGSADCQVICDNPRFSHRAVMLDCCRHFIEVGEIKKIIEQCSYLKLNYLHLHLSDDQGYRLESTVFPKLNKISSFRNLSEQDVAVKSGKYKGGENYGGYYLKSEIKDLIEYAGVRGVEIVPDLDVPGHSSAILAAFPEYTCSKTPLNVKSTFAVHNRLFCASNEKSFGFLQKLIDEICELFSSKILYLGGDEVPKTEWKKCPECSKLIKKYGNADALQTEFINKVCSYVKTKGRTPVVWNDSAVSGKLTKDAIIQYWIEMNVTKSRIAPEIERGRKFILSNMNEFYCDYSYAEIPLRATLNFVPNIKGVPVPEESVLGIEAPLWTEWLSEDKDLEKMLYPRILAVAECGWTKNKDTQNFLTRAKAFTENPSLSKLKPMPWEDATVSGESALRMIAEKMIVQSENYHSMTESDSEEAGAVEAVVAEDAEKLDPLQQTIMFMTDKMKAAYTKEDVMKVLKIMGELKKNETGI